jgi:hypothetical protein
MTAILAAAWIAGALVAGENLCLVIAQCWPGRKP